MGRAASAACRWGDRQGRVTAMLESDELILRGEIRARTPLHALERVGARGDTLVFTVDGAQVELTLGVANARRWADAIASPPPSLARKLGISPATRLHRAGAVDDDALGEALAIAAEGDVPISAADLAIVRTDDSAELIDWIATNGRHRRIPPIWIVFLKGRGAPLGENAVRDAMRTSGFIDTKIAAVSNRLSALRFIRR